VLYAESLLLYHFYIENKLISSECTCIYVRYIARNVKQPGVSTIFATSVAQSVGPARIEWVADVTSTSSVDPVIVGRSSDRRWIQRSSAYPVIVGRSSDRRWIQRSSVDPEIVGRSRDRRHIQWSSVDPVIVGGSRGRRWIQRSSADLEVGESRVSRQSFPSPKTCRRFEPDALVCSRAMLYVPTKVRLYSVGRAH